MLAINFHANGAVPDHIHSISVKKPLMKFQVKLLIKSDEMQVKFESMSLLGYNYLFIDILVKYVQECIGTFLHKWQQL